jgi:hypothetical protein
MTGVYQDEGKTIPFATSKGVCKAGTLKEGIIS